MAEARAEAQARQRADRAARRAAERAEGTRPLEGAALIWASWIGTTVFVTSAALAATLRYDDGREPPGDVAGATLALVLFGIGCAVFLVALVAGAQRSREVEMSIGGWFFLTGGVAPRAPRRHLMGSLVVEVVTAFATAFARPFSTLAFGILVPVYALALVGLWGARHGRFPPRAVDRQGL